MGKRTYAEIRNDLLKALADGNPHSYGELERVVNTNWKTIRDHCENLEFFGAAEVTDEGVELTEIGSKLIREKLQTSDYN